MKQSIMTTVKPFVIPICALLLAGTVIPLAAQNQQNGEDDPFIAYAQQAIAITQVRLVDGNGTPVRDNVTVLLRDGRIEAVGDAHSTPVSTEHVKIDGRGKTLLPGFVMMHEHLYYPSGMGNYNEMFYSFPKLYLTGGATTIRTTGSMSPYGDINLRDLILAGEMIGPDIDVTAPYFNGPGIPIPKFKTLKGIHDLDRMFDYWAAEGVTSYKAYMHISVEQLQRLISKAHGLNQKVTAHLCSVTYREAAELGIDNLEHGFYFTSDFVANKQKDVCPTRAEVQQSIIDLDINGQPINDLIELLIKKNVAITSTLAVFETLTKGRPEIPDETLDLLIPAARKQYEAIRAQLDEVILTRMADRSGGQTTAAPDSMALYQKAMALEKKFVDAGGTLMVGTDPTGYGGVIPGPANKRAIELLVETGFTFEEAIRIATRNAAEFLGRNQEIGTIEVGKRADLVLVDGDPTRTVEAIRNIPLVFKNGVGYDTAAIIEAMRETVGLH